MSRKSLVLLSTLVFQASDKDSNNTMAAAIILPEGMMLTKLPEGMRLYIEDADGKIVDITDRIIGAAVSTEPKFCGAITKTTGKPCMYDTRHRCCPNHDPSVKLCGCPTMKGTPCARPAGPDGQPCRSHMPAAVIKPATIAKPVTLTQLHQLPRSVPRAAPAVKLLVQRPKAKATLRAEEDDD
jgi:hypothetical protein